VSGAEAVSRSDGISLSMSGSSAQLHVREEAGFDRKTSFRFSRWTVHQKVSLALLLILVFFCALLSVFRPRGRFAPRRDLVVLGLVAFCAASFFSMILPCSSLLANRTSFPFSVGALVSQQWIPFLVSTLVFFGIFLLAFPMLGWIPVLLVQGFLIYEWLETGLFSIGFPSLAGSADYFLDPLHQGWDFLVLATLTGGFILAERWIRPVLPWVSVSFLVLAFSSLADVRPAAADVVAQHSDEESCLQSGKEVVEKAFFSDRGNVFFFLLDAIDVQVAEEVLAANPDWKDALRGFVAYTNNVGMYSHTSYGVAGIFTGVYAPRPILGGQYPREAIGTNSFFRCWSDVGNPVFTLQSGLGAGWSNITNAPIERPTTPKSSHRAIRIRTAAEQPWNISEISTFRALPFFEKAKYMQGLSSAWSFGKNFTSAEGDLFLRLRKARIVHEAPSTLHFYHTKGGHIPFIRDREGHRRSGPDNLSGYFEQSCYAIGETVKFLQWLDGKGLFDGSTIVLLADHGLTYEHFHNVERNTHPFLWVKTPRSNAPFARSGVPTSHSRISRFARESFARDLTPAEAAELLREDGSRVCWTNERRIEYDPHWYDEQGRPVAGPKD